MFSIRIASRDDLDRITCLAAATPEAPPWQRAAYEQFLSPTEPTGRIFVAENNGKITGFAAVRRIADVCELEGIAVAALARRSGIGRDLLATVVEWARKQAASRVQLEVRSGNLAAIGFYNRAGFRLDGVRRGYYSHPTEDALLMSLSLTPEDAPSPGV